MRPTVLNEAAVVSGMQQLVDWQRENAMIQRIFERSSFADAIAFVVRIGFLAEAMDHHPDVDIRYRTVTVALATHDAGGITELDLRLASQIDAIA